LLEKLSIREQLQETTNIPALLNQSTSLKDAKARV